MPLADVLTPAWLKARYLAGLRLTDDEGVEYDDGLYIQTIANGIAAIEDELGLHLGGIQRRQLERHDRTDYDEEGWHFKRLQRRPVRAVTRLQWKFGNFQGASLPTSFIEHTSPLMGDIRVVPSADSIESAALASVSVFYTAGMHHMTPGWWTLDYLYGFDDRRRAVAVGTFAERFYLHGPLTLEPSTAPATGQTFTAVVSGNLLDTTQLDGVGAADTETITWSAGERYPQTTAREWSRLTTVVFSATAGTPTFSMEGPLSWPVILEDCVGLVASMLPLDTAGDLLVGAGIASDTTSFDGLSVSKNTTASATNHGLGAKVKNYQDRLKRNLDRIKSRLERREVFSI